jgi:hypothetical protein
MMEPIYAVAVATGFPGAFHECLRRFSTGEGHVAECAPEADDSKKCSESKIRPVIAKVGGERGDSTR